MKMKYLSKVFAVTAVFLLPGLVLAGTVVRTGETVSVASDQTVEDDFYAAAGVVSMSGTVRGDMYTVGGSVTVNGDVLADLTIVSGSAQVHASVTDDVRIIGGEAVIAEFVGGDVFVMGGLLTVLSSAEITGDIYFFGGEAEIGAPVGGSVMGTADSIRIDSAVAGDVDVITAQQLTLGERANIAGNVIYRSSNELVRAQNAVVAGEVTRNTMATTGGGMTAQQVLTPLFVLLFGTLLLYLFFRNSLSRFVERSLSDYGRNGLIGLAILIGGPLVIVLSFVSVLGIMVGMVGFFALGLSYLLSLLLMGVMAGALVAKVLKKAYEVSLVWIIVGVAAVYLLLFVPIIGPFLLLILFGVTLGSLVMAVYRAI